jgi:hypothetical protein
VGGLFTAQSFASSYPVKEDLYVSELWKVDEAGAFEEKIENSGGFLINFEEVSFIEIFNLNFKPLATTPGVDRTVLDTNCFLAVY